MFDIIRIYMENSKGESCLTRSPKNLGAQTTGIRIKLSDGPSKSMCGKDHTPRMEKIPGPFWDRIEQYSRDRCGNEVIQREALNEPIAKLKDATPSRISSHRA